MSKKNFSSSVEISLNGRGSTTAETTTPVEEAAATVPIEETTTETITSRKKKSNAGRKKIADKDKRRNFSLSLDPKVIQKIEAKIKKSGRPRRATYYVSQYIENHLEELIDKI